MPPKITMRIRLRPALISICLCLLLPLTTLFQAGQAAAATLYIKPSTEVPIRSGQGTEFKILAVVPDGMAVELLEEVDPWARVRTPGGTEGWLLKRYLSNEPSQSAMVASLKEEKAKLEQSGTEIGRKFNELSQANAQNLQQLEACRNERDETRDNYEKLRQEAGNVLLLQKKLADTTRALQDAQGKLAAADKMTGDRQRTTALLWFLAGGLVLLCGWFLGTISAKNRKRKTTLY